MAASGLKPRVVCLIQIMLWIAYDSKADILSIEAQDATMQIGAEKGRTGGTS